MNKRKTILPPTYLLIYITLAVILHLLFPIKAIPDAYRILGIIPIIFGITINIWADNMFKKEKTTVKPDNLPSKLITKGPFSFSRHPMYLGFVSILIGISMALGSLLSFLAPILMYITLEIKFIRYEEKQMEKAFGKKYLDYKTKVRRWL